MDVLVIKDGMVQYVCNANSVEELQGLDGSFTYIERIGEEGEGWAWDGEIFIEPIVKGKTHPTRITKLAFFSRFTDAEAIAIDLASIGATVQAAGLRRALKKTELATYIDLSLEETRNGVLMLESFGLLAPGRALVILDTPVLPSELYRE